MLYKPIDGITEDDLQALINEGRRGSMRVGILRNLKFRPFCDAIWRAVGFPQSEYFDPDGKWLGHAYRPDRP
jgi:hypothetical protein